MPWVTSSQQNLERTVKQILPAEAPEGNNPANTLISNFWPPDEKTSGGQKFERPLCENTFYCSESLSLW